MLFHGSLPELESERGREREGESGRESTASERWREQGLHDNWPGRLAALCSFGWKEHHERSEEGAVGNSQQVSELK